MSITLMFGSSMGSFVYVDDPNKEYEDVFEKFLTKDINVYPNVEKVNPKFSKLASLFHPFVQSKQSNLKTGIMPAGVLAITPQYVVFERQPEYKNLFVTPKIVADINEHSEVYTYRIPVPWQVYIVHYSKFADADGHERYYTNSVRMHFMHTNLTDVNQEVFMAPLTNFYSNGDLCRPMFSDMSDIEMYPNNIAGVIQSAHDWVWNSGTNLDLTESIAQYYIQFKNCENTVFEKKYGNVIPRSVNRESYYITFDHVDAFLQAWEQASLDDVISFRWPKNSMSNTYRLDTQINYNNYLTDYLISLGQEPVYELHWDEDNDVEYQCDADSSENCECMTPVNNFDEEDFDKYVKEQQKDMYTFSSSMTRFIQSITPQNRYDSPFGAALEYGNIISSIVYSD